MPGAASFASTASRVARSSGVMQPRNSDMRSGALIAQGQAAAAGAVLVGVVAVGVEAVGHGIGQAAQLFGPELRAELGQMRFGLLASRVVDPAR